MTNTVPNPSDPLEPIDPDPEDPTKPIDLSANSGAHGQTGFNRSWNPTATGGRSR
jgi:hypothetical protein